MESLISIKNKEVLKIQKLFENLKRDLGTIHQRQMKEFKDQEEQKSKDLAHQLRIVTKELEEQSKKQRTDSKKLQRTIDALQDANAELAKEEIDG